MMAQPSTSPAAIGLIVLANFTDGARLRAFSHLALGRLVLRGTPGLSFAKVLGSGRDAGFQPRPSWTHQGLFCGFESEAAADAFLVGRSPILSGYRAYAHEMFSAKLRAYSSRGRWSGVEPLAITRSTPAGSIASLTRASIKPAKARAFWRHALPAETALHAAGGCLLAVGLGELPLVRQATFSIWESEAAMASYARSGAHLEAIRDAHSRGYFSESLFARFEPCDMTGSWAGRRWADGQKLAP